MKFSELKINQEFKIPRDQRVFTKSAYAGSYGGKTAPIYSYGFSGGIMQHISPNLEVLTLQSVTRTVKKWVEGCCRDLKAGQEFKFGKSSSEQIYRRLVNNSDEHAGQVFYTDKTLKYLYNVKPWTVVHMEEETTETTEEWV